MKKYLFGILAIVLALGFGAFKKISTSHAFVFDSSKGSIFSASDVGNLRNWTDADFVEETCESQPEGQDRACTIVVDEDYCELIPEGEGELRLKTSGAYVIQLIITNGALYSGTIYYQIVDEAATEAANPSGVIEVINSQLP